MELAPHLVYRCVIGSRAYGLAQEGSDTDRRGVFVAPAELQWSLDGPPSHIGRPDEELYWELQRFLVLALKANPTVLECLHTPLVEHVTPIGEELLGLRAAVLSKLVHRSYGGYVDAQFAKAERHRQTHGESRWKNVMHLIRLLIAGTTLLSEGRVEVAVGEWRDRLLAVREGEVPWEEVEAWRARLQAGFDAALTRSPLPEQPDRQRVDAFLISVRRRVACA